MSVPVQRLVTVELLNLIGPWPVSHCHTAAWFMCVLECVLAYLPVCLPWG